MEVISYRNMPIFTEIILLLIRQNTIPFGQRQIDNAFDHMELRFVINLTKECSWAIIWPPIFATGRTGYVSFVTTFLYQVASTCYLQKKINFSHWYWDNSKICFLISQGKHMM